MIRHGSAPTSNQDIELPASEHLRRSRQARRVWGGVFAGVLMLLLVGIWQKIQSSLVLRHVTPEVHDLMHGLVWALPLAALLVGWVSGSDALRAVGAGLFLGTLPLVLLGAFCATFEFGAVEEVDAVAAGDHVFRIYRTNRQGALGDYGLEVWRNRPLVLGFEFGTRLRFGGEGYHPEQLKAIDERCVTVVYRKSGEGEVRERAVCVER